MNEHLNHLGIYTDLTKFQSVVMLHPISRAKKIILGLLTVNMETLCFSKIGKLNYQSVDAV